MGLSLNVSQSKTTVENPSPLVTKRVSTDNNNGVTLYGRKFFGLTENFSLFGGIDINLGGGKSKVATTDNSNATTTIETKNSMTGANLNAGIAFAVTPKIMIYGKWGFLGWSSQKSKYTQGGNDVEDKSSSIGFNVNTYGVPFNVGMYFTL